MYAKYMLDEKDFQRKADAAFEDLKKRLLTLGDEHGFDVEGESGKLEVIFEEPEEAKFVVSPNTPVREIWISALSTSFKLGWNVARNAFVHEKTGEDLHAVMSRVVSQQIGEQVTL
ncbi:MAG TPA: iron donor protein CyaY [Candidatus Acidoferrum sp.]|nr:iron donor protein CyaY [Candidatus Acidoferrum sp.]